MNTYIEERTIQLAKYIIDNKATVRSAAKHFGISKSTVHKDITQRLQSMNLPLSQEIRKILDENKSQRHIRGGIATRKKYKDKKKCPRA
ncbi:MAG: sporulation transcriptional regulator SpoIIID [Clostridiaceae bacterium]|nr:sporulation transcriptional regulator SpoIIID [Clostridiaceae bacterium]